TISDRDWSSDVCSSDLDGPVEGEAGMNAPDKAFLAREYSPREAVPDHPQYFARWTEESAKARSRMTCHLDLPYGDKKAGDKKAGVRKSVGEGKWCRVGR